MRNFWKTVACLGAVVVATAGEGLAQEKPGDRAERLQETANSALRMYARDRIAAELERRAVRDVDFEIAAADARRIASRLSREELTAVAAGEREVQRVVDEAVRSASAPALGSALSELVFVPLPPCRIIDTRVAGGIMAVGEVRDFQVSGITQFGPQGGTLGGCGIPPGSAEPNAPAVVINFVAVGSAAPGNLVAWPWGQPKPNASVINYANVPGLNIANGVIVPIAGTNLVAADLHIQAQSGATHLVADVTGYFTRFPLDSIVETEKSITVVNEGGLVDLSAGECTVVNSCTIDPDTPGQVIVRTWAQVSINHGSTPGGDRIAVGVKNIDPTICSNNDQSINATDFEVPEPVPPDPGVETTVSHKRIYTQSAGPKTYYINAKMITGASSGDVIENSRMICTFIPD